MICLHVLLDRFNVNRVRRTRNRGNWTKGKQPCACCMQTQKSRFSFSLSSMKMPEPSTWIVLRSIGSVLFGPKSIGAPLCLALWGLCGCLRVLRLLLCLCCDSEYCKIRFGWVLRPWKQKHVERSRVNEDCMEILHKLCEGPQFNKQDDLKLTFWVCV
jgi:hypothetical protein